MGLHRVGYDVVTEQQQNQEGFVEQRRGELRRIEANWKKKKAKQRQNSMTQ